MLKYVHPLFWPFLIINSRFNEELGIALRITQLLSYLATLGGLASNSSLELQIKKFHIFDIFQSVMISRILKYFFVNIQYGL